MKRNKTLTCIVSLALACAVLAGCSGGNKPEASESPSATISQGAVASATPSPTPAAGEYEAGTRTDTTYESQWLGLRYTVPADMVMYSDEQIQQAMQLGAEYLYTDEETGQKMIDYSKLTITYEMVVGSGDGRAIALLSEKMSMDITEEQYFTLAKSQLEGNTAATYAFGDVTKRTIAGVEFYELPYTLTSSNGQNEVTLHQTLFVKKMDGRMVTMTLTYAEDAQVEEMLAGFTAF